jgi:hypothetical protein
MGNTISGLPLGLTFGHVNCDPMPRALQSRPSSIRRRGEMLNHDFLRRRRRRLRVGPGGNNGREVQSQTAVPALPLPGPRSQRLAYVGIPSRWVGS